MLSALRPGTMALARPARCVLSVLAHATAAAATAAAALVGLALAVQTFANSVDNKQSQQLHGIYMILEQMHHPVCTSASLLTSVLASRACRDALHCTLQAYSPALLRHCS
jgi:hypothetical protein